VSEHERLSYVKDAEYSETIDKYTFVIRTYFREKDVPSIEDVVKSLVLEKTNRSFAYKEG